MVFRECYNDPIANQHFLAKTAESQPKAGWKNRGGIHIEGEPQEEIVFYNRARWPWAAVRNFAIGLLAVGTFLFASGGIAIIATFVRYLEEERISDVALQSTAVRGVMVSAGAMMALLSVAILRICVRVRLSEDGLEVLRLFSKRIWKWEEISGVAILRPRSPWSMFLISLQQFYAPGKENLEAADVKGKHGKKLVRILGAVDGFRELPREIERRSRGVVR